MMWETILACAIVLLVFMVCLVIIYYLMNYKNVKKQKEHYQKLHQNLSVGQQVIFLNGIYGTLVRVGDETVDIKMKSGAILEVSRFAITTIIA